MCWAVNAKCRFCKKEIYDIAHCFNKETCELDPKPRWDESSFTLNNGDVWHLDNGPIRTRNVCIRCDTMLPTVMGLLPQSYASRDLSTRPSYACKGSYMCPALLDAMLTAATHGLRELSNRVKYHVPLEKFNAVILDLEGQNQFPSIPANGEPRILREHELKALSLHKPDLHEDHRSSTRTRKNLRRHIRTLNELLEYSEACNGKKTKGYFMIRDYYKVLIDTESAPDDHINLAITQAFHGSREVVLMSIYDVERRRDDWKKWDHGKNTEWPRPISDPYFKWVDSAFEGLTTSNSK
jgi:hypothetical protein